MSTASKEGSKLPFKMEKSRDRWEATCPRGLWSVSADDLATVIAEAKRYYFQYKTGGEYDHPTTHPANEQDRGDVPPGYSRDELDRDNPYNAWMNES
jgi:hypothetical protein